MLLRERENWEGVRREKEGGRESGVRSQESGAGVRSQEGVTRDLRGSQEIVNRRGNIRKEFIK